VSAITFDTLKAAKEFQQAGFTSSESEALASKLSQVIEDQLVTRSYLDLKLAELRNELFRLLVPLFLGQAGLIAALVKLL
jgi:hypothetical protein